MKALINALPLVIGSLLFGGNTLAANIDFGTPSDPIYNTTDPTVGDVKFWAGDPNVFNDTFVDDLMNPGNNYLLSGVADGTGMSPASGYDYFIGVSRVSSTLFGTVSVDIASDTSIPSGTPLVLEAFLAGTLVGSTSFDSADYNYHTLSLTLANGADTLYLSDALNSFGLSDVSFHIDNFAYTDYQASTCPNPEDPNCGGGTVPEPGALWLFGASLLGLAISRRWQAV